ncbi:PREDICTED: uncharacterized protein LOC108972044 [Bactrocera latifrons]|uniref:uncharacterized protein LOC108972044 n=1 Tax=Bactrocera latifrons TaxID=174628 RepID=UPI0008DD2B28|nr:PREDICTED: uncharacterized protein LOC108972044 [Bactrocera latifrons]
MVILTTFNANWEMLIASNHVNFTVLMFLFMVCAFEVVLWKLTLTGLSRVDVFGRSEANDNNVSEYEEDIYYGDLRNNYERWTRRQTYYRHQVWRLEQERLTQFRVQLQHRRQLERVIC